MPVARPAAEPEHVIRSTTDKWRFKCPNFRHDDWRLWNGVFACRTCQRLRDAGEVDVDPIFAELWDAKERELVPRERIRVEV